MDQRELKEFWKAAYLASLQGHRAAENAHISAPCYNSSELCEWATIDADRAVDALAARWSADAEKVSLQRQEESPRARQMERERGQ